MASSTRISPPRMDEAVLIEVKNGISESPRKLSNPFERMPKEMWFKIIESFEITAGPIVDSSSLVEYGDGNLHSNRVALCSLSATCKALTGMAQAILFRHALYVPRIYSYCFGYNVTAQESLYQTLLNGRAVIQAAVRSIAFDLSLDIDYDALIACLPKLTDIEFYASGGPPRGISRFTQVPTLMSYHKTLSRIKVSLTPTYGGFQQSDFAMACLPLNWNGNLQIDSMESFNTGRPPPGNCIFPHLYNLTLSGCSLDVPSLTRFVGTNPNQNLVALFVIGCVLPLGPIINAFGGSSLRTLVLSSGPPRRGDSAVQIAKCTELRWLGLPGWLLTDQAAIRAANGTLIGLGADDGAASDRNIAGQLPNTIELLQIQDPCLDIFRVALHTILPRLPRLRRLEIEISSSDAFSSPNEDDEQYDDPESEVGQIALQQAGELDIACEERGMLTKPSSFREAFLEEIGIEEEGH